MVAVKRILVPTDFSDTSYAALRYAIGLAQAVDAHLYLLHVPGKTGENFEADFPFDRFERSAQARVDMLVSADEAKRLRPEYTTRIGAPAEQIVRYAGDRDIDLIIMGTHGRSGVAHVLLGSVAEHVVRAAPCPVLVIRPPACPTVAEVAGVAHEPQAIEPVASQLG